MEWRLRRALPWCYQGDGATRFKVMGLISSHGSVISSSWVYYLPMAVWFRVHRYVIFMIAFNFISFRRGKGFSLCSGQYHGDMPISFALLFFCDPILQVCKVAMVKVSWAIRSCMIWGMSGLNYHIVAHGLPYCYSGWSTYFYNSGTSLCMWSLQYIRYHFVWLWLCFKSNSSVNFRDIIVMPIKRFSTKLKAFFCPYLFILSLIFKVGFSILTIGLRYIGLINRFEIQYACSHNGKLDGCWAPIRICCL